jgi:hypothetical protein
MYLTDTDKATLVELIGTSDLDITNPADLMLATLVGEYARLRHVLADNAKQLVRDLTRVADGTDRNPTSLAARSNTENYDRAVHGLDVLRTPLQAARVAYRMAHNIAD